MNEHSTDTKFLVLHQGAATNELTKLKISESNTVLYQSGRIRITQGSLVVDIDDYEDLDFKLKTSTYRLLDFVTAELTRMGTKSQGIEITLKHYMDSCGLKNGSTTRRLLKNDLDILSRMKISYPGDSKGKYELKGCQVIESKELSRGSFSVCFSKDFFEYLVSRTVMPYPLKLFEINPRTTPYSYYLLRRISEHKNMNFTKRNSDIISVKSLIEAAGFPKYSEIISSGQVRQRIIVPFERDMNALDDILEWSYQDRDGSPFDADRVAKIKYSTFIDLLVRIVWTEYPTRPPTDNKSRKKKGLSKKKTKSS